MRHHSVDLIQLMRFSAILFDSVCPIMTNLLILPSPSALASQAS
jgi:hypothetical protein